MYTAEDVAAVLTRGVGGRLHQTRDRDSEAAARTGNLAPDTVLVARRLSPRPPTD